MGLSLFEFKYDKIKLGENVIKLLPKSKHKAQD